MKVAIAYQDGEIFGHFGHCETFAIYDYYGDTTAECNKTLVDSSALHGHAAMAELMREKGVDAVMAGNMGPEARAALLSMGIVPITGYSGHADTAADLLVTGQLPVADESGGCGGGCGGGCSGGCGGGCGPDGCGSGCGC